MKLRVVSYNIRNGHDVRHNMSLLADDILSVKADLVGLQEVDVCTLRTGGRDTLAELARALGWEHYAFCRAIDFAGGQYGTAILSRYPIRSFTVTELPSKGAREARSVGHAVLDVDGERVDFFNTHLSVESSALRAPQFDTLATMVANTHTWVLTGDFNTADLSFFSVFAGASLANPGKYATFPDSGEGIDNVVCSPAWRITNTGTLQNYHSDHLLLWADIEA